MSRIKISPIPEDFMKSEEEWRETIMKDMNFGVKNEMLGNISTPPTATYNHIADYDATLMYPHVMQSFNEIQKIGNGYYTNEEYPFDVKVVHSDNIDDYYRSSTELYYGNHDKNKKYNLINYERFDRRLDAEKYRLENLYYYYKHQENDMKASIYFQQLKTIEEEHPEWLI